jgi:hypothetical protein
MDELREVHSIGKNDTNFFPEYFIKPDQIICYCQGLVELDHNSGIVRFTHYTVQEFLNDKYLANLLAPTDIAKACLTYPTFDVFDKGPCPNEGALAQHLETYKFSEYASRY